MISRLGERGGVRGTKTLEICIGFLNDLFYGPELYRGHGRDVNFFSA